MTQKHDVWTRILACLLKEKAALPLWHALGAPLPSQEPYASIWQHLLAHGREATLGADESSQLAPDARAVIAKAAQIHATLAEFPALIREAEENAASHLLGQIAQIAQSHNGNALDTCKHILSDLSRFLARRAGAFPVPAKQLPAMMTALNKQQPLTSKFQHLNRLTLGYARGGLHIVASRPNRGKTWWLIHEAVHLLKQAPGLIVSCETSVEGVTIRLLATLANLEAMSIRQYYLGKTTLSAEQLNALQSAAKTLAQQPLHILAGTTNLELIEAHLLAAVESGIGWVAIDYLQLLSPPLHRHASRREQVSFISNQITRWAKEHNLAIIAACQIRRHEIGKDEDTPPTLSSLKESGDIEQDADNVIGLSRLSILPDGSHLLRAEVLKSRDGSCDTFELKLCFNKSTMTEHKTTTTAR